MSSIVYIDNDNIIEIPALTNGLTGVALNDAGVAVTLTDTSGNEIDGQPWPLIMPYVPESDGQYRATLPAALILTPGQRVTASVSAEASGLKAHWKETITVMRRT